MQKALSVVFGGILLLSQAFAVEVVSSTPSEQSESNLHSRRDLVDPSSLQATLKNIAQKFRAFPVEQMLQMQANHGPVALDKYQHLTKEELEKKLTGNTLYGITAKKNGFAIYFDKGGVAYIKLADGRQEQGSWSIENGHHLTLRWPTIGRGKRRVTSFYSATDDNHLAATIGKQKTVLFLVVVKGDPEGLRTTTTQLKDALVAITKETTLKNYQNTLAHFPTTQWERVVQDVQQELSLNDYRKLTRSDFETEIIGHTLYSLTFNKRAYAVYFDKEGLVYGKVSALGEEKGHWSVNDQGKVEMQWPKFHHGEKIEGFYYASKEGSYYLGVSDNGATYRVFIVEPGDPEKLLHN